MNKNYQSVEEYWKACQDIADAFTLKYYSKEVDWAWSGKEVGGIILICDDFWSFHDLVTALELDAPEEDLFKWYNESFDRHQEGKTFTNLRMYLKHGTRSTTKTSL